MTKRTNRKPPLPRSPIHVGSKHVLRPSILINTAQSQSGSLMKTTPMYQEMMPNFDSDIISIELREMANFATPLFKRGRFYEQYSAKRNEWLKMKQISYGDDEKNMGFESFDIEVDLESEKRRDLKKFNDKKSLIPRTPLTERRENVNQNSNSRYMLRSMTKEMKKPASSLAPLGSTSSVGGDKKTGSRRGRKI